VNIYPKAPIVWDCEVIAIQKQLARRSSEPGCESDVAVKNSDVLFFT
jgi:hypothetical protein